MPRVSLPFRGASNATAYLDQPGDTAPLERLRNFRVYDARDDRARGGTRPGLRRAFDQVLAGGAAVQGLGVVTRASSIESYTLGDCADMTGGESKDAGPLLGHLWLLDRVPSMSGDFRFDSSDPDEADDPAEASSSPVGANACAWFDDERFAWAGNAAKDDPPGQNGRTWVRIGTKDGSVLHPFVIEGAQQVPMKVIDDADWNYFTNTMVWSSEYLFVLIRELIFVFSAQAELLWIESCNGWSQETVEADVWRDPDTGTEYLYVAFDGSNKDLSLPNTDSPVSSTVGYRNRSFRSGVMRFEIIPGQTIFGGAPIQQIVWGQKAGSGDKLYEADHGYFRFAEYAPVPGMGRYVRAMRAGPDGSVFVATTNLGWGFAPDGQTRTPNGILYPTHNLWRIGPGGDLKWVGDTDSIIEPSAELPHGDGTTAYWNDIRIPSAESTLNAVAVDAKGDVYAAGRVNAAGVNVWKLSGTQGVHLWQATVMNADPLRSVRQATMRIDPTDGHLVVGGDRNDAWQGAQAGEERNLWKIDAVTGAVVWAWDIDEVVSAIALDINQQGEILYGTDWVT